MNIEDDAKIGFQKPKVKLGSELKKGTLKHTNRKGLVCFFRDDRFGV